MANNEVLANLKAAYLAAYPEYANYDDTPDLAYRIQSVWGRAAGTKHISFRKTDAEIRAWQPEQSDPLAELTRRVELVESQADRCVLNCEDRHGSLSERISELQRGFATLSSSLQALDAAIDELSTLDPPQPAPEQDDPVCARDGCGHKESDHIPAYDCGKRYPGECNECSCPAFLPAPPAAPEVKTLCEICTFELSRDTYIKDGCECREPAEPLDPVLVAEAMYICWMGDPWPRPPIYGACEFKDLASGARERWIRLASVYGKAVPS